MSDDHRFPDLFQQIDDAFGASLDPIPTPLAEAARGTFAWRLIDAVLADLEFDLRATNWSACEERRPNDDHSDTARETL
jgi:hypothetical protein